MSLFKSAFTVGSLTFCSRILGYVRDVLIAAALGAGPLADAFFVAFRLPNFFRQLSAEGAFNNAFVPLFSGKLESDGKKSALEFAEHVLAFMFVALLLITIVIEIFMPAVMHLLAPGFVGDEEKFQSVVGFGRIVFPYLIFISLVALLGGILNSMGKFAAFAAAPILLNVCMILALLVLSHYTNTPADALAWGVVIAGVAQLIWMFMIAVRHGVFLRFRIPRIDEHVKILLKRMVPGIVGGGVTQINLWINTLIATMIPSAVSYLYYADRLVQFPLAIIGTAMGTALLPTLSKHIKAGNVNEAIRVQNKGLEIAILFTIPAAVGLAVVAEPLISVMFERGEFGVTAAISSAKALVVYSTSLPAFVLIKIFAPGFFANGDTRTPVKIAAISLVINVVVSVSLMGTLGHLALATGTALSSWTNAILLGFILNKRDLFKVDALIISKLPLVILASSAMAGAIFMIEALAIRQLNGPFWVKLGVLSTMILVGVVVFFLVLRLIKGYSFGDLKALIRD